MTAKCIINQPVFKSHKPNKMKNISRLSVLWMQILAAYSVLKIRFSSLSVLLFICIKYKFYLSVLFWIHFLFSCSSWTFSFRHVQSSSSPFVYTNPWLPQLSLNESSLIFFLRFFFDMYNAYHITSQPCCETKGK